MSDHSLEQNPVASRAVPTTPHSVSSLDRAALNSLKRQSLHARRNWSKAEVYTIEWPPASGQRVVVKDMWRCPLWFRALVGRRFLGREAHVLQSLHGVGVAPELIGQPDADSLLMSLCEGTPARDFPKRALPLASLEGIVQVVADLHARGITHGDLHSSNVLVAGERITLLDWATAHEFGSPPYGLKAWLFEEWRDLDLRQVAKIKMRHAKETLSHAERELLVNGGSRLYRFVRQFGYWKDRLRGKEAQSRSAVRKADRQKLENLK